MKKAIPLYDEAGEQRTVWEVLKEVKDLFEEPKESYAIEISEAEIKQSLQNVNWKSQSKRFYGTSKRMTMI